MFCRAFSLALFFVLLSLVVSDDTPIQHRIALLPDGMTVSWSAEGKSDIKPQVKYGTNPNQLHVTVEGITQHYASSKTYFHHVEIHGLAFNTRYYWQVVTKSNTTNSPIHAFTTQPDVNNQPGNFSVAIYGDLGIDNSVDTLNLLRNLANKRAVDLFFHVGQFNIHSFHWLIDCLICLINLAVCDQ